MLDFERQIDDVVLTLRKAKEENIKVNLLIGAGCSATANIPTAAGFVNKIKEYYPLDYERATPKDYGNCMSKLTPFERRNLIMSVVNESKINWAHIAIAQLLKENYINRIITTNFDNLIQRACSLVGEFPAIYDLTTSENFRTDLLFDKSVLHLHGQYTGFIQCNTGHEVEDQAETLRPIFEQLSQQSIWIIVGYSGNNDPIFRLLTEKELFEYRLFWVGYKNEPASEKLSEMLLSESRYAFYIKGFDADSFFVTLSQRLDCFPPSFIQKPFTYLSESLDAIATYSSPVFYLPNYDQVLRQFRSNIQLTTQNVISKAIESIENDCVLMAEHFLLAGLVDEVIKLDKQEENEIELEEHIISAYLLKGSTDDFKIARDRALKLIERDGSNCNHNVLLGTIYLNLFLIEQQNREYINLANKAFVESIKIEPTWQAFLVWGEMIDLITSEFFIEDLRQNSSGIEGFKVDTIVIDYLEAFDKSFLKVVSSLDDSDKIMSLQFVYSLIDNGFFELAEKALVIFEKYQDLLGEKALPYLEADWGMWFFRNVQLDLDTSKEKAIAFYMEALRLIKEQKSFGNENEMVYKSFYQKYLLEHGKFLLYRKNNKDEALNFLQESIGYVELKNNKFYKEALRLIEELGISSQLSINEAASSRE
jgi:hypothetical protein